MCEAHAVVVYTKLVDTIHIGQFESCMEYSTYNKCVLKISLTVISNNNTTSI